jgi:hypothetical protein
MASTSRRVIDSGVALIGISGILCAAVGLPLYADGALYFLEIVLEGEPLVPNGRYSALFPQLPVLLAATLTDEILPLRHAFSLGYALLPFLSFFGCWLVVRTRTPDLILYPALFLVANQVNFSAVSELLMALYLTWPFVLLAVVSPAHRVTWAYGILLAPLLLYLHPLAFVPLLFLGLLAWWVASRAVTARRLWWGMTAAFISIGLVRLLWSVVSANSYERSQLQLETALYYLFPDTWSQTALLGALVIAGALFAVGASLRGRARAVAVRLIWTAGLLIGALGLAVAMQIAAGEGVRLKAGMILPIALLLMGMVALVGARAGDDPSPRWVAPIFVVLAATAIGMAQAKAYLWGGATAALIEAMAAAEAPCVTHTPDAPAALHGPRMAPVNNWTAPMAALVFRVPEPIPLLLPDAGCQRLEESGIAYLTPWWGRPAATLQQRFGPLRGDWTSPM